VIGGLRIYQWFALLSFLAGMAITMVPATAAPEFSGWLDIRVPIAAVVFGVAAGLAMGVDFPRSGRRFARLADP
jgi:hypothetical protein